MKNDILIIGAMKMEVSRIKGAVHTGFGKEKTRKTIDEILKNKKPSFVISVGMVGAVVPELNAGDLFIPETIIDYENPQKKYYIRFPIDKKGVLVTVPKVFEREHKYELRKIIPDASAVDMETSVVAESLEPAGIPFLCVMAVCDGLDFDFADKKLLSMNIKTAISNYTEFLNSFLRNIR